MYDEIFDLMVIDGDIVIGTADVMLCNGSEALKNIVNNVVFSRVGSYRLNPIFGSNIFARISGFRSWSDQSGFVEAFSTDLKNALKVLDPVLANAINVKPGEMSPEGKISSSLVIDNSNELPFELSMIDSELKFGSFSEVSDENVQ